MEFRKDIQGLRALAVIMVWLFHLNYNFLPGGFIGVDLFFVISGYLISSIILKQKEQNRFSFIKFYTSRIKRIVPAYYTFLIIISIVAFYIYLPFEASQYRYKFFQALIFNSNNYFAGLNDYFGASSSENPLLHTWTLALEMQFYLILPIILIFFSRRISKYITIFLIVTLYIYTQYQLIAHSNSDVMYYSLLSRSPEFLLGTIISYRQKENPLSITYQSALGTLGLIMIVLSSIFISSTTMFPGLITLIPCIGTLLILDNKKGVINKVFSTKFLVYIGELSYSIYLWHWGILALMRYYYVDYYLTSSQYLFAILLTLVLSYISYRFIEIGFKKLSLRLFSKRFIPLVFATLLIGYFFKPMTQHINQYEYPENLTSSQALGLENHGKYSSNPSLIGNSSSSKSILLLGNSHALVLNPFINEVGKKFNYSIKSITFDSYPTIPGLERAFFDNSNLYNNFVKITDGIMSEIEEADIILIAVYNNTKGNEMLVSSLPQFCNQMKRINKQILLISDFPCLKENPIRINRTVLKSQSKQTQFEIFHPKISSSISAIIESNDNLHYVDLSDSKAFIDAPFYNDTLMYYDKTHLNKFGSLVYEKYSGDKLAAAIDMYIRK